MERLIHNSILRIYFIIQQTEKDKNKCLETMYPKKKVNIVLLTSSAFDYLTTPKDHVKKDK